MPTYLQREEMSTEGDGQVIDLTPLLEKAVANSGFHDGTATAFARHTTVGITAMEHEHPGGYLLTICREPLPAITQCLSLADDQTEKGAGAKERCTTLLHGRGRPRLLPHLRIGC